MPAFSRELETKPDTALAIAGAALITIYRTTLTATDLVAGSKLARERPMPSRALEP